MSLSFYFSVKLEKSYLPRRVVLKDEMGYAEHVKNISRSYFIDLFNSYIVLNATHFS